MKKIFLMRHSIPEKGDMPMKGFLYRKREKHLLYQKENIFKCGQMLFFTLSESNGNG